MLRTILPVFDESDLAAVPNALEFFRRVGLQTLMILHNPSIGLKGAVTDQYDARIRELKAEMAKAATREDFTAASEYKMRLEEAQTDKDMAIREGWSKVSGPEREAVYKRIFGSTGTDAVICLNENLRPDQLFSALNGLLEVWPKDMPHGEFSVVWPKSIPVQSAKAAQPPVNPTPSRLVVPASPRPQQMTKKKAVPYEPTTPDELRSALRKSRFGGVQSACKKHGITTTGKSFDELIEEVVAATFGQPA